MPEGPEIRRAADVVAKAIVNRPIEEVFFAFDHLKPYAVDLQDSLVTAVETHGKAMLTRFDNGLNVYSHNQLYGKWVVRNAYSYPETKRSLRFAIHNEKKSALLYSASSIEVVRDHEIAEHHFLSKLGPDLLNEALTVEEVKARFMSKRFMRRGFPSLLLDQHFVAGLGNYLRSEALYVARIWPKLRPIDCTPEQIDLLARACVELTRQSYHTKGITNDLALAEELKQQGVRWREYRYWVFGRDERPCWNCGAPIMKTTMGGRRIYYCPREQVAP